MNEQQVQELKLLVDRLQSEGMSNEDIQAQVDAKTQEFIALNKSQNSLKPVKTTTTTPGAVVGKGAAPNTDSSLEDGSLELPKPRGLKGTNIYDGIVEEMRKRREQGNKNMLLNERKGSDKDYEEFKDKNLELGQKLERGSCFNGWWWSG